MTAEALPQELRQKLASLIGGADVVLFMKGTRSAPRCGFSASVVEILDELVDDYNTVDVLADPDVREGIKVYSDWPTIPQLYVKGELIGGADIAKEMFASGELAKKLGAKSKAPPSDVNVIITPAAAKVLLDARKGEPAGAQLLRIAVSPRYQHQLGFSEARADDVKLSCEGVDIVIDPSSARRANGVKIDAVTQPGGGVAFRIENPNEPPSVKQMTARELKQRLDDAKSAGKSVELFDVRTPGERAQASIPGSRLLDDDGRAYLEKLPKDTPVVFHCHHGGRSQAAADHYLKHGFTTVYNVAGGIDAWSQDVDPTVPRY
jgi:monothiol glutaredoxin